jgi:signal transduction histidine kinase
VTGDVTTAVFPGVWKTFAFLLPTILLAGWLDGWRGMVSACFLALVLTAMASTRIRRKWSRLEDDHDRIEAVLTAIHDGVIALDSEGKVTLLNRSTETLLSVSAADWLGKSLRDVCDNAALVKLADAALAGDVSQTGVLSYGDRTLEAYATLVDAPTKAVLVIHDVSEMRQLESVRRDFVANVSHELKTPLTSIRAYVETLLDGGLGDEEVNLQFLRKVEVNAARLSTLISDLLTLSRIESGTAMAEAVALNAGEILQEAHQELAGAAEKSGVRLQLDVTHEPLEVTGDAEALQQTFNNLIRNAIQYTAPGGQVKITGSREGSKVRVEVKDTGIGIPAVDLPRIFERFYRVDKARSRELGGTGLGLSICKHYVQSLDGEIDVESEVGVGSSFVVQLPAK